MGDITAARPTPGGPVESTWGGQVHDQIEGIQAGVTGNVTLAGGATPFTGTIAVTFPRAYTATPVIVCTPDSTSNPGMKLSHALAAKSATGFTVQVHRDGGSTGAVCTVHWIAIGTPA